MESLSEVVKTSTSASVARIEDRIQSSTTSLGNLIKDEIHRTMSSIPRETNISRKSLETLSILVSEIVTSQIESRTSENSSNRPRCRQYTERQTNQVTAEEPQTHSIQYATASTQFSVDTHRRGHADHLYREEPSSRFTSRTSVQKMTCFFGTVFIRRSTVKQTFPDFDPEFVPERAKVEINFLPATWLRSWTGCGTFLARVAFGTPKFDFNLAVARILEWESDPLKKSFEAIACGDVDALKALLQLKVAYPTDRNSSGFSLLAVSRTICLDVPRIAWCVCSYVKYQNACLRVASSLQIAAGREQLDICKLLLQQGAAIDINMPTFTHE